MDQEKKPSQSEDATREGAEGQQGKKQGEQRQPGQESWRQPGKTDEEKKPEKREDVA